MKINLQARCDSIRTDFLSVAIIGPVDASQMKLNPITDDIMNRIHQKMSLEQKIQTIKENDDRDHGCVWVSKYEFVE